MYILKWILFIKYAFCNDIVSDHMAIACAKVLMMPDLSVTVTMPRMLNECVQYVYYVF
jgi:hypothetical protein